MAERKTDIGPPHYEKFLPPIVKKNYGKWDHHEILAPGVMVHVAQSGDKLYTVRAATPRLLSIKTIRLFADLADKYSGGHLRFTSRSRRSSGSSASPSAAPATRSRRSSTPRAGCTVTPRRPTPPASSSR
jgi:hypothetical protein